MGENGTAEDSSTERSETLHPARVLEPGNPIPSTYFHMFELKVMDAGNEMIPTGWNNVDASKNYKPLLSRLPKVSRRPSSESADVQTPAASSESSDADELAAPIISAQPSFANGVESDSDGFMNQKSKNLRTYTKKGHNQPSYVGRRASESSDASANFQLESQFPILNLGEAIVVDWTQSAYDALFQGIRGDDMRGQESVKVMETLVDNELADKRSRRSERKKKGISLEECFTATAKGEILTEENAWYCNRCKELRQAEKTLEIWTAPDILVIHLKRFSAHRQFRDKIDVLVDFPIEGLDLNDKVGLQGEKDLTYDLFAVDNHYGGLGGGHYTAFAKSFVDEKWYEYNGKAISQYLLEPKTNYISRLSSLTAHPVCCRYLGGISPVLSSTVVPISRTT